MQHVCKELGAPWATLNLPGVLLIKMTTKKQVDRAKEKGLCTHCRSSSPDRKPKLGASFCRVCLRKTVRGNRKRYLQRRYYGPSLCPRCGKLKDDDDLLNGTVWCIGCCSQNSTIKRFIP